jgi:hypothetical protein
VTWHPLLDAREDTPGVWTMTDQRGDYGTVRIVSEGGERFYRAWLHDDLVGVFPTLKVAVEKVHTAYIGSHGPGGFAPNPWPSK